MAVDFTSSEIDFAGRNHHMIFDYEMLVRMCDIRMTLNYIFIKFHCLQII